MNIKKLLFNVFLIVIGIAILAGGVLFACDYHQESRMAAPVNKEIPAEPLFVGMDCIRTDGSYIFVDSPEEFINKTSGSRAYYVVETDCYSFEKLYLSSVDGRIYAFSEKYMYAYGDFNRYRLEGFDGEKTYWRYDNAGDCGFLALLFAAFALFVPAGIWNIAKKRKWI